MAAMPLLNQSDCSQRHFPSAVTHTSDVRTGLSFTRVMVCNRRRSSRVAWRSVRQRSQLRRLSIPTLRMRLLWRRSSRMTCDSGRSQPAHSHQPHCRRCARLCPGRRTWTGCQDIPTMVHPARRLSGRGDAAPGERRGNDREDTGIVRQMRARPPPSLVNVGERRVLPLAKPRDAGIPARSIPVGRRRQFLRLPCLLPPPPGRMVRSSSNVQQLLGVQGNTERIDQCNICRIGTSQYAALVSPLPVRGRGAGGAGWRGSGFKPCLTP